MTLVPNQSSKLSILGVPSVYFGVSTLLSTSIPRNKRRVKCKRMQLVTWVPSITCFFVLSYFLLSAEYVSQMLNTLGNPALHSVHNKGHKRQPIFKRNMRCLSYQIYEEELFRKLLWQWSTWHFGHECVRCPTICQAKSKTPSHPTNNPSVRLEWENEEAPPKCNLSGPGGPTWNFFQVMTN